MFRRPDRLLATDPPAGLGPVGFLVWLYRQQAMTFSLGVVVNVLWMLLLTVIPFAVGRAIDEGVKARVNLWGWTALLLGCAVAAGLLTLARESLVTYNRYTASFRLVQVVTRHAHRVGRDMKLHHSSGEIVSISTSDSQSIGTATDQIPRALGAIAACGVLFTILWSYHFWLAVTAIAGLGAQVLVIGPLAGSLQRRLHHYRAQEAVINSRVGDIVGGLRVLRGIGGEDQFCERFHGESLELEKRGRVAAAPKAWMATVVVAAPGLLLIAMTWVAVELTIQGRMSIGDLIAVFGYGSFLWMPLTNIAITAQTLAGTFAAARRVVNLLEVKRRSSAATGRPYRPGRLVDPMSGLVAEAGQLTVVVADDREAVEYSFERLAGYTPSDSTIAGVAVASIDRESLRANVTLLDDGHYIFAGHLDGKMRNPVVREAVVAADIIGSLDDSDGMVAAGGRNLSGGQRQRVRLGTALDFDADLLLAVEPTSALDACTESLVVDRVKRHRSTLTTVICSHSPFWLNAADRVVRLPRAEGPDDVLVGQRSAAAPSARTET